MRTGDRSPSGSSSSSTPTTVSDTSNRLLPLGRCSESRWSFHGCCRSDYTSAHDRHRPRLPLTWPTSQTVFAKIKQLGERAIAQLSDEAHFYALLDKESNSIAVLIRHLRGNMLSRWTDFLTTDGEKETRNRDTEFVQDVEATPDELVAVWNEGWDHPL